MTTTRSVRSSDGTEIAYTTVGAGSPLVLVDGAFGSRAFGPNGALAAALADRFAVTTYDRRGRGESGDGATPALQREIEDLEAVLGAAAGGSAALYGISSGGALVLEAAARVPGVTRIAVYEAPFIVDSSRPPMPADFVARVQALVAAGRRGEAVGLFLREGVEMPRAVVALMRLLPAWSKLKAVVHTLPYDLAALEGHQNGAPLDPARWAEVTVPALVLAGGRSPAWMRTAMAELARVLPDARHRTLDRQTHMVAPRVLAPALADFLASRDAPVGAAR